MRRRKSIGAAEDRVCIVKQFCRHIYSNEMLAGVKPGIHKYFQIPFEDRSIATSHVNIYKA